MRRILGALLFVAPTCFAAEPLITFVEGERIEYRESEDALLIDVQGWVGRDLNKFWWKLEGESGDEDEFELQALYSRATTRYFDLQLGAAFEDGEDDSRASAVIGWHGLAPQWFETDLALFVRDSGDVAARLEFEYDLLLTQRLILQPRAEFVLGSQTNVDWLEGSGFRGGDLDIRLRYEIRRELAPYVGVSWSRAFGRTGQLIENAGGDDSEVTAVIGLRFWF